VGYYGYDKGNQLFDESGAAGTGVLADITKVWEAETAKAAAKQVC